MTPLSKKITIAALLMLAVSGLYYFKSMPAKPGVTDRSAQDEQAVSLQSDGQIQIQPDAPFNRKIERSTIRLQAVSLPELTVTGSIIAKRKSAHAASNEQFEFINQQISSLYANWKNGENEIEFLNKQYQKTKELNQAKLNSQRVEVDRLKRLVEIGTEAARDLSLAEANLLQAQLEGQKALFDLQSALNQARNNRADTERQLFQEGIDINLLSHLKVDEVLVAGDVPEASAGKVYPGQKLNTVFYGDSDKTFPGELASISPLLSFQKRSLRIYFTLADTHDLLRPGMFADIQLGTEAKNKILISSEALIHINKKDYVLVLVQPEKWKPVEVSVGDNFDHKSVEILEGLHAGDTLIEQGAILLKPLAIMSIEAGNLNGMRKS